MSFPFDLYSVAMSDTHLPCHAVLLKATAQHGHQEMAMLCCGLEKKGMVGAWHGKCELDMAALCKSNEKDTF